ncbi:hypothetical protein LXL04_020886 [Taraxacum kok-saghyz]
MQNFTPLPKPKIPPIANSAHSPFLTKKTPDSALDLVLLILPYVNTMMLFEDSRIGQKTKLSPYALSTTDLHRQQKKPCHFPTNKIKCYE